jgi:hypothetical protein
MLVLPLGVQLNAESHQENLVLVVQILVVNPCLSVQNPSGLLVARAFVLRLHHRFDLAQLV